MKQIGKKTKKSAAAAAGNKTAEKRFSPQAYPLYVWGLWAETVRSTNPATGFKLLGYKYHTDRLTIVGWMQMSDTRVEPMVFTSEWGVVPIYELTGSWPAEYGQLPDYYELIQDRDGAPMVVPHEDFVLVDIAMSQPDREMFEATKQQHLTNCSLYAGTEDGELKDLSSSTVVEENKDGK